MAPKKGGKAKAKSLAVVAAGIQQPQGPANIAGQSDSVNAEYFKKVADALLVIAKHWPDIKEASTLGLTPEQHGAYQLAGHQAALDQASYTSSMAASNEAAGGLSIFTLDIMKSATPGVPVNSAGVMSLAAQRFGAPKRFPSIVTIAVEAATFNIFEHRGALLSITPLELLHALIFAVTRDITEKKLSEKELLHWKAALLSIPVHVRVLGAEASYYEAISIREEIAGEYEAAYFTAFQRIYMVEQYRVTQEGLHGEQSYEDLAIGMAKIRFHQRSEAMTPAFIESALTLFRRVLSNPKAQSHHNDGSMLIRK